MKTDDSFHEIGDLLRSRRPEPVSSPGLENRILGALGEKRRQPAAAWCRWLALPAAIAGVVFLLMQPRTSRPESPAVTATPPVESPAFTPAISEMVAANPLHSETLALARDAGRAGDFLFGCLPQMTVDH